MVTGQPEPATLEGLDEELAKEDAFAPQEYFQMCQMVTLEMTRMPDDILKRQQVDVEDPQYKLAFPDGVPALHIALQGIDVDFAYSADHLRHIYIATHNTQGQNYGRRKGERSQLHVVSLAFDEVFGLKPFGTANREKLVGLKARWGQHIDSAPIEGQNRTWRWDIPRMLLSEDFVYSGAIRVIEGRDGAAVGMQEMDEEAAIQAMLQVAVGRAETEVQAISFDISNIQGLPEEWQSAALNGEVLRKLGDASLISVNAGIIVGA